MEDSEGFITVSHKRWRKRNQAKGIVQNHRLVTAALSEDTNNDEDDVDKILSAVRHCTSEMRLSDYFKNSISVLKSSFNVLSNEEESPTFQNIVCYGIGNFSKCLISRHQLALLLCLKDMMTLKPVVSIYDPLFTNVEKQVLKMLELDVIEENEEGKRKSDKRRTLFYMPHCGKPLYNNVLWSNWSREDMEKTIIVGNSFQELLSNIIGNTEHNKAQFMKRISTALEEFKIPNCFRLSDVFNSMAIHVFPQEKLALLSDEEWDHCEEPVYSDDDEIVTALKTMSLS